LKVRSKILKRIHVAQPRIRANTKILQSDQESELSPPIICTSTDGYMHGNVVIVYGSDGVEAARIIYNPTNPICSGARVWIETRNEVEIL
jgi:hypothetical protein